MIDAAAVLATGTAGQGQKHTLTLWLNSALFPAYQQ